MKKALPRLCFLHVGYSVKLRQPHRDAHVDEHAYHVVGDGDKRAGSDGGVYLELLECHGDEGAEQCGKHHHAEEREAHRVGGWRVYAILPPVVAEYGNGDDGGIDD